MEQGLPFHPLWLVPLILVAVVGLWLAITGILGLFSGWYRLQGAFPDRPEEPVERLRFQSAAMGGANFGNCLTFDLCPGGLRVSMMRLLGGADGSDADPPACHRR